MPIFRLSSWQRRDVSNNGASNDESMASPPKRSPQKPKRKYPRSRSRSRSPVDSLHSRRSSPTRSVSPELKRRRRHQSPQFVHSPVPGESDRRQRNHSVERRNASPTHSHLSRRSHASRFGSRSSSSRSRSRSVSPVGRRSKHRLPTATNPEDIQFDPMQTAVHDEPKPTTGKKNKVCDFTLLSSVCSNLS